MHMLMSFLGCIGTLMSGSGLEVLLGTASRGLTSILNGICVECRVELLREGMCRVVEGLSQWRKALN